jgi:hypothetical protein
MVMAPDSITKKCDTAFRCRYIRDMLKRRSNSAVAAIAYDNFLYLLAEMEASFERGAVQWTAESAEAAQRRLVRVLADLSGIAIRLRAN